MKTFFKFILSKVLKYLAESSIDELMIATKLVKEAAQKFASTENKEKFNFVFVQLKETYKDKEDSVLRYLIETAVRLAKKNSEI